MRQQMQTKRRRIACGFRPRRICDRKFSLEREAADTRQLQSAKRKLISHCPTRHKGHTQPGFYGVEQTFGGIQLHVDLHILPLQARAIQCTLHAPPRSRAKLSHQQLRISQLLHLNLMIGPFMTGGNNQSHLIFHERLCVHIFSKRRSFNQRNMDSVGNNGFEHFVAISTHRCHADAQIVTEKACHQVRKHILPDGLRCADCQLARLLPGGSRNCGKSLIGDFFQPLSKGQKRFAARDFNASSTIVTIAFTFELTASIRPRCEVKTEVQAFTDVNVAWLKRTLIAAKVANPKDAEKRARAIYSGIMGAQFMARSRSDIALYDRLIESYRTAGLLLA